MISVRCIGNLRKKKETFANKVLTMRYSRRPNSSFRISMATNKFPRTQAPE